MGPHIVILEPQVAAKIAAGEVIERPSAVVRELLDNAIDAGATNISLHIEEGGLQLIRVSDDGLGMGRADLELCYRPHATSKIRQTNDLLKLASLGFRGEALGSIAACSKLRLVSAQEISGQLCAYELRVADSLFQSLQEIAAAHSGTQVEARELFYSFPARRKFLKSARAELASCKTAFKEKALAFPHIHFFLYNHGKMEISLPPGTAIERICQVFSDLVPEQLFALTSESEYFSLEFFAAAPAIFRRDRKRMPIYINQRPIAETSLQHAIRLGFDTYLAGGLFPICFCFMQVQAERVDFNIHPAKREARLRDVSLIQNSIRQTLRKFCAEYGKLDGSQENAAGPEGVTQLIGNQQIGVQEDTAQRAAKSYSSAYSGNGQNGQRMSRASGSYHYNGAEGSFAARDLQERNFGDQDLNDSCGKLPPNSFSGGWRTGPDTGAGEAPRFCYLGQLFEVFLLVQRELAGEAQLLIVDQHASHERILYETLESEMLLQQPLLVPIELEVEPAIRESLLQRRAAMASIGIRLEEANDKNGIWRITSLPPSVSDLKEDLLELVRHGASEAEDLKRELFAHLSCRKAIKKGDILDDISATQLLRDLFARGLERCPHGRPLWYSLSQKQLYSLLQRT